MLLHRKVESFQKVTYFHGPVINALKYVYESRASVVFLATLVSQDRLILTHYNYR
jgi:hypothetical protein